MSADRIRAVPLKKLPRAGDKRVWLGWGPSTNPRDIEVEIGKLRAPRREDLTVEPPPRTEMIPPVWRPRPAWQIDSFQARGRDVAIVSVFLLCWWLFR